MAELCALRGYDRAHFAAAERAPDDEMVLAPTTELLTAAAILGVALVDTSSESQ